jgi:2-polyprenyl-3-methyl-5-hydroxy-6-metoxy-1,4-benzoquinol methylase
MGNNFNSSVQELLFGYSKYLFLKNSPNNSRLLDIGCGNHSPSYVKKIRPDIRYVGTDIQLYNLNEDDLKCADQLLIFEEKDFFSNVKKIEGKFDLIIASHIIEHLPNPAELFEVIDEKLSDNGYAYIATPNPASVNFPKGYQGCLNYYDDPTHLNEPIGKRAISSMAADHHLTIYKSITPKHGLLAYLIGLKNEPKRKKYKRKFKYTWNYWGFEDIFVLKKDKAK